MKKRFFLAVLAGFLSTAFTLEREDTEGWKIFELKGKVKSLEQKEYRAILVDGKIQKGPRALQWYYDSDFKIQFSDKGLVIEEDHIKSDDQPYYHINYCYDAKGNLIEDHYRDEEGICKMYYYYDRKGRIQKEISFEPDSVFEFEKTFQYKGDTVFSEKIWKNENGKVTKRITEIIDPSGHGLNMSSYDSTGKMDYSRTRKYDAYGNTIESTVLEDEVLNHYTNSYVMNKKGKVQELISTYGRSKNKIIYAYDSRGNCINEKSYDDTNNLVGEVNYQFDENNKMVKRETIVKEEVLELLEWIYQYDQNKNWISCTYLSHKKPTYIVERTLQYY